MENKKDNNNTNNNNNLYNNYSIFSLGDTNFRNDDYILKLNTSKYLKFFKDELTIKYIGKGYNTIDFAVKNIHK
jgi:hypothetical protein